MHMKQGIFADASSAVAAAREAQARYAKLRLGERDRILAALRQALAAEAETLAGMTMTETGMGNLADKVTKIRKAALYTTGIEDLPTEAFTGDYGMTLYELSPYGVVGAAHPCTNPCATIISNTISLLAGGNAVVHCPHARAAGVSKYLVSLIDRVIEGVCGISNLVVAVEKCTLDVCLEVLMHPDVDLIVCTGGWPLLRCAAGAGKRLIGAGPSNPVAMVDETADMDLAARDILAGISFDNNLMCSSEKNIVVTEAGAGSFLEALRKNGAYYMDKPEEISRLKKLVLTSEHVMNKKLEGKSAIHILEALGIDTAADIKAIIVPVLYTCPLEDPLLLNELLMPVVPILRVPTFDAMLEAAVEIEQRCRHTATIHTAILERMNQAAKELQTSIFVKNGSSLHGLGFDSDEKCSFTIANVTGEGFTSTRTFTRRRRCYSRDGFSIR